MTVRCIVRGATKKAWLFFGLMIALAAVALLMENLHIAVPIIAQIVLLLSLVCAVYILVRYITSGYLYEIIGEASEENDTVYYLYIVRMQGKKGITQAKLPLSALTAVAKQKPEGIKKSVSNFSPVLLAEDDVYLAFSDDVERSLLRIHADEAFVKALLEASPDAKDHLDAPPAEPRPQKPCGMYDISDIEPPKEDKNGSEE